MKGKLVTAALVIAVVLSAFVVLSGRTAAQDELPFGPWVDTLVWQEQTNAALALEQIKIDQGDYFMFSLQGSSQKRDAIQSLDVRTISTFGSVNGLLFNPNQQVAGQPFNPLTDADIRKAMQWLIDRETLNREVLDGFAVSFVVPFHPKSPDYFRELTTFQPLETTYSADFTRANDLIAQRMQALGATIDAATGVWKDSNNRIINLQIIARIEDERLDIGNYVAEQLRAVKFRVTVNPSPSSDAIPLVYGGDPSIGNWHIYTEGWAFTALVAWDDFQLWDFHACAFEPFCQVLGNPAATFKVSDDTLNKSIKLGLGQYTSLDERQQLIRELTPLAFTEGNYRMWIQAEAAVFPVNDRVESFVFDAFGGPWTHFTLKGSKLLPDQPGVDPETGVGGTLNVLNYIMFNDAWNPWVSPGWLYDSIQRRALSDPGMYLHPQLGTYIDYRVQTSVVTAGPTGTLAVPTDALIWNVTRSSYPSGPIISQGFVPVGSGVTATSKVTTNLTNPGKWHTGSDITMDDVVYYLSNAYRRSFGDIAASDGRAATTGLKTYLRDTFKGFRVIDADTIETYINYWHVDPAQIAANGYWYADAPQGAVPWEIAEAAVRTVVANKTAIHEVTATGKGVPWLDLGRNPASLAVVTAEFNSLRANTTIPVGMSPWIDSSEAGARYTSSFIFRSQRGHFWASNGPFYLESIDAAIKQSVMQAFRTGYPFKPDKWDYLTAVQTPDVTFGTFPTSVLAGQAATLDFSVEVAGAAADPEAARWFVRELATGETLFQDLPLRTGLGEYEVQISPRLTNDLVTGSFELVVIVQGASQSVVEEFTFAVQSQIDFFQALITQVQDQLRLLGDDVDQLGQDLLGVSNTAGGLTTLITVVLALAVIAIAVPVVMMVILLRRMPPPGGG